MALIFLKILLFQLHKCIYIIGSYYTSHHYVCFLPHLLPHEV